VSDAKKKAGASLVRTLTPTFRPLMKKPAYLNLLTGSTLNPLHSTLSLLKHKRRLSLPTLQRKARLNIRMARCILRLSDPRCQAALNLVSSLALKPQRSRLLLEDRGCTEWMRGGDLCILARLLYYMYSRQWNLGVFGDLDRI
jgi:hypothetical protein